MDRIYKNEKQGFKIHINFGYIVENKAESKYEFKSPKQNEKFSTVMMISCKKDLENYKHYITSYISEKMEEHHETSKIRYVAIYCSEFEVYPLGSNAAKINIPGYEWITKNKYIFSCDTDNNLCMFYSLFIAKNGFTIIENDKKMGENAINARAKTLFKDFYKIKTAKELKQKIQEYNGLPANQEQNFCNFFNVNLTYYYTEPNKQKYDIVDIVNTQHQNEKTITMHLLRIPTDENQFHVMLIKDVLKITDLIICPHCRHYAYDKKKDKYHHSLYLKHIEECEKNGGKIQKKVILDYINNPYAPHIQKQKIFEFLLAHNLKHEFKPTRYFITFDFETLEKFVNKKYGSSSIQNATLHPFMVSSTVRLPDQSIPQNFCLADDENFIDSWIKFLFEQAKAVSQANKDQYKHLINILPEDLAEQLQILLDNEFNSVPIIGYNSGKFDLNIFIQNLVNNKNHIHKIIGSTSKYKMVKVGIKKLEYKFSKKLDQHVIKRDGEWQPITKEELKLIRKEESEIYLKFIDILNFIAGGSLKSFVRDYAPEVEQSKAEFPYQFVTMDNWREELYKSEPFEHEHFHSDLTQSNISDANYQEYVKLSKQFQTRLDYFKFYCNNDVSIMLKPIDNLISDTFKYNVDMLQNLSLSANASMIKYAFLYEDFINKYDTRNIAAMYDKRALCKHKPFELAQEYWKSKCDHYKEQDKKAKRSTLNNVTSKDFTHNRQLILTSNCHWCAEPFTFENKPTLDRLDNSIGHTKDNCVLSCLACNRYRSDRDPNISQLRINLRKYALMNNLPFTLAEHNRKAYNIILKGITGGLSNVQHRINFAGETKINKIYYDEATNTVYNKDTENIMTHFIGYDFNQLYPSGFSSTKHEFINYTNGKMYMPGQITAFYDVEQKPELKQIALDIINNKKKLFIAEVKGHIDRKYLNEFINFLPIFRNINITNDEKTLGSDMYNFMRSNKMKVDHVERKLTQLADTYGEYMSFSSYYLWYLIDRFHFIIDDIKSLIVFNKQDEFGAFVVDFSIHRWKHMINKSPQEKFFKNCTNGSYGYDAMNTENYSTSFICQEAKTQSLKRSNKILNIRQLSDSMYQVDMENDKPKCNTCIQQAYFTLDNAKYWYLVFVYEFMHKCLDMNRIHFIEGDTDSAYWAVAGNPEEDHKQGFKNVVIDKEFYDEHVFKFLPYDTFCFKESSRPTIQKMIDMLLDNNHKTTSLSIANCFDPEGLKAIKNLKVKELKRCLRNSMNTSEFESFIKMSHKKKLLGLAIENEGHNMIALSPKCYTSWNNDGKQLSLKNKGVNPNKNKHITYESYLNSALHGTVENGCNTTLQMKKNVMSRLTQNKIALTSKNNKSRTLNNGCCLPFVYGAHY